MKFLNQFLFSLAIVFLYHQFAEGRFISAAITILFLLFYALIFKNDKD